MTVVFSCHPYDSWLRNDMLFQKRSRVKRKFGVLLLLLAFVPLPPRHRHKYALSVYGPSTGMTSNDVNRLSEFTAFLLDPFCSAYSLICLTMGIALLVVLFDLFLKAFF